ncbi:MAG TPA: hypothetical protein GX511_04315 [Firmicutes bacterium]|nr:hypothetical protein [Bacillota bacterium]
MGEKIQEIGAQIQKLVTEGKLSPDQALLQAGINLQDKAKLYELAVDTGIIKDEPVETAQLMAMAQSLTAALDPATKQALGTLIRQVAEQSGAGAPPPEIQSFLDGLLNSKGETPPKR